MVTTSWPTTWTGFTREGILTPILYSSQLSDIVSFLTLMTTNTQLPHKCGTEYQGLLLTFHITCHSHKSTKLMHLLRTKNNTINLLCKPHTFEYSTDGILTIPPTRSQRQIEHDETAIVSTLEHCIGLQLQLQIGFRFENWTAWPEHIITDGCLGLTGASLVQCSTCSQPADLVPQKEFWLCNKYTASTGFKGKICLCQRAHITQHTMCKVGTAHYSSTLSTNSQVQRSHVIYPT